MACCCWARCRRSRPRACARRTTSGLAGFDNNDWTALPALDVTTVAQPTYDIGRTAAELLLQRMQDADRPVRQVVLEGTLVVRGSSVRAVSAADR